MLCTYRSVERAALLSSHLFQEWLPSTPGPATAPLPCFLAGAPFAWRQVAKWAGLKHSEEVVQRAITRSSFKSMRRKEEAGGLLIFDEMFPKRDKSWRMTRKGKSGGWEECFTSSASKDIFNEKAYSTMFDLGYVTDENW